MFVVDGSGSIRDANPANKSYDNWVLLLDFIVDTVDKLNIGSDQVRVGIVKFSTEVKGVFPLNEYTNKEQLKEAIRGIEYMGGHTNTAAGIRRMHTTEFTASNGDRSDVQNIAIVITDGESTIDPDRTIPEAQTARNKGIKIFAVGITNNIKESELRDISSAPHVKDEDYFLATSFQSLQTVTDSLTAETCGGADNGRSTMLVVVVECALVLRLCSRCMLIMVLAIAFASCRIFVSVFLFVSDYVAAATCCMRHTCLLTI